MVLGIESERSPMAGIPGVRLDPPLVIASAAEFRAFSATRAFFSNRPVVLGIAGLSPEEAFAAAERLNKDRSECGCALGAHAMTAGFILAVAALMIRYGPLTLATLERVPIAMVVAVICAALGKTIGITTARRRARRDVARMLARLAVSPSGVK